MGKPFLDFYGDKKIIPVRQDIRDLQSHFRKREALYRHLGMPAAVFRGKRVLEFGPGSGDDAVHTASMGPSLYVLVDGNPYSVRAVQEKISQGQIKADELQCIESEILAFQDKRRFDVVTCEGVVPGQTDPAAYLRHIASFADTGGIVYCTAHSPTSLLAEICRRMLKPVFAVRYNDFDDQLTHLTDFVTPDLDSLKGMTRLYDDWVLDTILHPWRREVVFTVPDAIDALDDDFDVVGTSPRFAQDWRWYKAVPGDKASVNGHIREEYDKWSAYFLDYRIEPDGALKFSSKTLEDACADALDAHVDIWENDDVKAMPAFLEKLSAIADLVEGDMSLTARSIADFIVGMKQLLDGNMDADFGAFRPWFGRGLQYVSLIRRAR